MRRKGILFRKIIGVFQGHTLRFNFALALITMSLLSGGIITWYYFSNINAFYRDKILTYQQNLINMVSDRVQAIADQEKMAEDQAAELAVTSNLFENYGAKSEQQKLDLLKSTESQLMNIRRAYKAIDNLYLVGYENEVFTSNQSCDKAALLSQMWMKDLSDSANPKKFLVPSHEAEYGFLYKIYQNPVVVSSVLYIKDFTYRSHAIGAVQVDIKYSAMENAAKWEGMDSDELVTITDAQNRIFYYPDKTQLGKYAADVRYEGIPVSDLLDTQNSSEAEKKSQKNVYQKYVDSMGWTITLVSGNEIILAEYRRFQNTLIVVLVLSLVIAVFLSYFLAIKITKPLNRITESMKEVSKGDFDISVKRVQNRDLQILVKSFNEMVVKIKELIDANVTKEHERAKMEMVALQSQINSHFLYNTLNTIKWMAIRIHANDITKMIVSLVKILEYSSKVSDTLVPVPNELTFIRDYLFIQEKRFNTSITVTFQIEEELNHYMILKMLLQPIVENSIIHAFSPESAGNVILIQGRKEGESLSFEICDNGKGMKRDSCEKLTGIGISNVRERIRLNFGDQYGLKITSEEGKGTRVVITIPAIGETGENDAEHSNR